MDNMLDKIDDSGAKVKRAEGEKRTGCLGWDEYYMGIALLESRRNHKSQRNNVAIVANSAKFIISVAHDDGENIVNNRHAEIKALESVKHGVSMIVMSFPCEKCARIIVEYGIEEIMYYYTSADMDKSKEILEKTGVKFRQFVTDMKEITIDLNNYDNIQHGAV